LPILLTSCIIITCLVPAGPLSAMMVVRESAEPDRRPPFGRIKKNSGTRKGNQFSVNDSSGARGCA
jgi:hypothetical protein